MIAIILQKSMKNKTLFKNNWNWFKYETLGEDSRVFDCIILFYFLNFHKW